MILYLLTLAVLTLSADSLGLHLFTIHLHAHSSVLREREASLLASIVDPYMTPEDQVLMCMVHAMMCV